MLFRQNEYFLYSWREAFISYFPEAWWHLSHLKLHEPVFTAGFMQADSSCGFIFLLKSVTCSMFAYAFCVHVRFCSGTNQSDKSINKLFSQYCLVFGLGKQPSQPKTSLAQSRVVCCWWGENVWVLEKKGQWCQTPPGGELLFQNKAQTG